MTCTIGINSDEKTMYVKFPGDAWEDRVICKNEHEVVSAIITRCHGMPATLYCSSTIDFPEESTSKRWILDFCHQLRSRSNA